MAASTASTSFKKPQLLRAGAALIAVLAALSAPVAAQRPTKAGPGGQREERDTRRRPAAPQASIFFCSTQDVQCRTEINDFGLDELRDLFVFVAWTGLSGEHTQQVRFLLPNGHAYQVNETKFTTLSSAKTEDVQVALRSRGEPTVAGVLPVAGTHITQRSLAGTWIVEVYLDGKFVARTNLVFHPREQR